MSDLSNLLLLVLLLAVVGLWLKLSVARERAVQMARRQCLQHDLQLLDETVGLRGLRLRRVNGLESSYAKVDTDWLAALCLELDGRAIAKSGVQALVVVEVDVAAHGVSQ